MVVQNIIILTCIVLFAAAPMANVLAICTPDCSNDCHDSAAVCGQSIFRLQDRFGYDNVCLLRSASCPAVSNIRAPVSWQSKAACPNSQPNDCRAHVVCPPQHASNPATYCVQNRDGATKVRMTICDIVTNNCQLVVDNQLNALNYIVDC